MSLFSFSYHGGGGRGAFFLCVSGVVINARSAHTIGALVEELTCSKNQHQVLHRLIGINGGDVLYFDQCMDGNINAAASSVEHAFCGMTGCDSPASAMVPEAKHTCWKKIFTLPCPRVPVMVRAL